MTTLVLDASSGISGDMTVAALLDLGADFSALEQVLKTLPDQQFKVTVSRVKKFSLDACDFKVTLLNGAPDIDHDMDFLFGDLDYAAVHHSHRYAHDHEHEHEHTHEHGHGHEHKHEQEHEHIHDHHHHAHHEHRHLKDVLAIIDSTSATAGAKALAGKIFDIVAQAEARSHGVPVEQVHFHEVGALDSIIDILSVAVLIDSLNVSDVIVTALGEGYGEIRCQHGILPIPVPAVSHIAQMHGLTLSRINCQGEFITPTGAAIVAAVKTGDQLPERYRILKTGLGAGKREYPRASLLRAMLIEADNKHNATPQSVTLLQANIDDSTPEMLGFALERLYEEGILEAWFTPAFMKKGRPAYILNALCCPGDELRFEQVLFKYTTTIGIRRQTLARTVLPREIKTVPTAFGSIDVKVCSFVDSDGKTITHYYPEFDSAKKAALENHVALADVYRAAKNAAEVEV